MNQRQIVIWIMALLGSGQAVASCGSAYCTVNTGWDALGSVPKPGWTADLRYEYLKQDTLRAGNDAVAPAGVPDTHDEIRTLNHNLLTTLAYAWDSRWGVSVQVPYLNRNHSHMHNDPDAGPEPESWDIGALGDARVIGVYQFASAPQNGTADGVRFGLKLPTGSSTERNRDGESAERSLQPGTGTSDLVLGVYHNGRMAQDWAVWFVAPQWQQPLNSHAGFRPGSQFNVDTGLSRRAGAALNLLLQLNLHWRDRDRGTEAEPEDSGSRSLSLSPGLAVDVGNGGRIYGFVQLPLYQHVNGVQLTVDWSAVVGWRQRF